MAIILKGWAVVERSFITKGFDPTKVTKYVLTRDQYKITIEEFFGSWKLERTLSQGQFLESYEGLKDSEVNEILGHLNAPTLDDIDEEFNNPGDFIDPIQF